MLKHFSNILLRTPLQSLKLSYQPLSETGPIFQEGLYLSSPEYWNEFLKRDELKGKDKEKLELSFAKYWLRSCSRCTPYGTFAGSLMVPVTEEGTKITLADNSTHMRRLRLDMNYMSGIIQVLEQQSGLQEQLKFYTNNSLYELPDGFRYAEYTIDNNTRSYHLTSIEKTDYIQSVLERARTGAGIAELAALICAQEDVTVEEAREFILSMIQSQLLISELEPCVTGQEPLDQLIDQLQAFSGVEEVLGKLKKIQGMIREPQEGVAYLQQIEQELKDLGLALEVPKNTLQTDLYLSVAQNSVNKELIEAVVKQAEELTVLARQGKNAELDDFKKNFFSRYEEGEVPLAIILDADLGLGYAGVRDESAGGGPLVDDIGYAGQGGGGGEFDYLQQYTLSKYNDYLKHKKPVIELKPEELKEFEGRIASFRFANSIHVMGSLMKKDAQLDPEHFSFDLSGMGGPSAGNLLGRFTSGSDVLRDFTRTILKEEETEYKDAIYAEIAHLPQARIGNILLRPVLRGYEIPYIGKSGIDAAHQIPVEDLMVSVRNNEVVLRSKSLNKRVIPRLTTAHNFGYRSLPVYKFLCDLQMQGLSFAGVWDWGNLAALKQLPRVVYKDLILYKATWKVEEKEINDLPKEKENQKAFLDKWRDESNIPQRVVYKEGDNELLIDFGEDSGIELFLHYLKRYKMITLEEFLFTDENCIVADKEGNPFTNEIIIPLNREPKKEEAAAPVAGKQKKGQEKKEPAAPEAAVAAEPLVLAGDRSAVQKKFSPFSEWLYFKIYCGTKTGEKVLKENLLPFIESGLEQELFEKFFFIRYRDDFSHLRFRFYNSNPDKQLEVQKQFMLCLQPLLDSGMIDKVAVDTYSRELERYRHEFIEEAELLFHNDSLAILRFINLLEGAEGEQYRFLFALRGIDLLLSDFGLNLEDKTELARQIQGSFFREFGGQAPLQKLLNDKYRKHQKSIFQHMDATRDVENEIDEAVALFAIRTEQNMPVIEQMKEKLKGSDSRKLFFELLPSYIHMFMNRLFVAQQRKYELVIYHFLERYYSSQLSIQKKGKTDAVHRLQTT
ncbi:lantibiotic dehydratase [Taibaiella koreensis]|uniref:lantibiotic dehydratase n=1 Tax=Taibaiella koreensis TaxID=1268548 RepID=UPI000E59B0CD|nr:lantibiotic dehydratase [Taibaiella koreensis]